MWGWAERCPPIRYRAASGTRAAAASAAAAAMTPSITTGRRRAAAPTMKPARAAISSPPSSVRMSSGSARTGRAGARAPRPPSSGPGWRLGARPPAGDRPGGKAGDGRDDRGRGGGVADAHVAGHQHPGAPGRGLDGDVGAHVEGAARLHRRHRRLHRDVAGPRAHRAPHQAGRVGGDGGGDADVGDDDFGPGVPGEDVDGRPAGAEVRHHLRGDLLGPRGDALRDHAMVGREHRDGHRLGHGRRAAARDGGQLDPTFSSRPSEPGGLVSWLCRTAAAWAAGHVHGRDGARRPDETALVHCFASRLARAVWVRGHASISALRARPRPGWRSAASSRHWIAVPQARYPIRPRAVPAPATAGARSGRRTG